MTQNPKAYLVLFIQIFIILFPVLSFGMECPRLFTDFSSENKSLIMETVPIMETAPQNRSHGLRQKTLKTKGFPGYFHRGVKEADRMINISHHLRKHNVSATQTHIEDFASQISLHISYIKNGFLKLLKQTSNFTLKQDIHKNLTYLKILETEAHRRKKKKEVNYEWWVYFNLRLTLLLSVSPPSFFDNSFVKTLSSKINKTKTFLLENISIIIKNGPKGEEAGKRLVYLEKLEDFFISTQRINSLSLEQIEVLYFAVDQLFSTPLNEHLDHNSFLDIPYHPRDRRESPFYITHNQFIKALSFLSRAKKDVVPPVSNYIYLYENILHFPDKIFFPTIAPLGIMHFNRIGLPIKISPIGIKAGITKTDGVLATPEFHALHDIEHAYLQQLFSSAVDPPRLEENADFHHYFNHYLNTSPLSRKQRMLLETIYFFLIREHPPTQLSQNSIKVFFLKTKEEGEGHLRFLIPNPIKQSNKHILQYIEEGFFLYEKITKQYTDRR